MAPMSAPVLAATPNPPYTAVIFSSLGTDGDNGYGEAAARMEQLAAEQPGYLGIESARDPDSGLGITVSYWSDAQAARAWKSVAEHLRVQTTGRQLWYADYTVRIATVERDYRR